MKKQLSMGIVAVVLMSCNASVNKQDDFIKTASGFDYKIIKAAQPGDSIRYRDVVKVQLHQYIDDSLLNTTVGKMPDYVMFDNKLKPFDYTELLPLLRVNDSAVCLFPVSKVIEQAGKSAQVPAFLQKGKYIKVYVKILASFPEEVEALADKEKTQNNLLGYSKQDEAEGLKKAAVSFDSLIQSLPQQPMRLPSGVYVQITEKGSGQKVKEGQEVGVIYKGRLLNGTPFDEATAASPLLIHVGTGEALEGFDKAIASLSIGDKATIYIPAPLALGAKKAGEYIPAFSNFIFDVTIINPLEKKN